MEPKTIDSLKELLTPVAQKIGETAEWGWGVVIKQMYVEAAMGGATLILGIITSIITYKIIKWCLAEEEKSQYSNDYHTGAVAVGILGGGFSLFLIVCGFEKLITHIINPEFYAIQFFIGLVK